MPGSWVLPSCASGPFSAESCAVPPDEPERRLTRPVRLVQALRFPWGEPSRQAEVEIRSFFRPIRAGARGMQSKHLRSAIQAFSQQSRQGWAAIQALRDLQSRQGGELRI